MFRADGRHFQRTYAEGEVPDFYDVMWVAGAVFFLGVLPYSMYRSVEAFADWQYRRETRKEILALANRGESPRAIANELGISEKDVLRIGMPKTR